ncbi:MAG: hypothetical protein IPI11_08040 [Haliscomenobacter sp.]|nr:hypothetical protein [Haliscomenobacter sp.]
MNYSYQRNDVGFYSTEPWPYLGLTVRYTIYDEITENRTSLMPESTKKWLV